MLLVLLYAYLGDSYCLSELRGRNPVALSRDDGAKGGPEWIAVFITHNLPEAHIVLGKLEANSVPAIIHQEAGASALGITLGNLGEIKILVSPSDVDRAASLIYKQGEDLIEASNEKIQLIWRDDGDGAEYYVEDDDE